ncbi:MAG TPA: hypothetical protein HA254_00195 [Candidatus Diapherotrites archaeon]|uniref:Uncharacterized protein n=1 Tax=Candidatus Iainarchaeum sp. TaxID=3101447 RepID=A0A7J4IW63_9ARCH|nr:hypothetical protein [Candidatus Diapherotrites archaeon]
MQTIELVGYMVFTIVVAGLITIFMFNMDFAGLQGAISSMLMPGQQPKGEGVREVNINQFAGKVNSCWQQCLAAGDQDCGLMLISKEGAGDENITVSTLRDKFRKLNYCTSCNVQVLNAPVMLPAVVKVTCKAGKISKIIVE